MPFKPIGVPNSEGFYGSFEYNPIDIDNLKMAWSTPAQRVYNAATVTCRACDGRGYAQRRIGRNVERDKAGCERCLGLGKVPR